MGDRTSSPDRDFWVLPVRPAHPDGTRLAMAAIPRAAGLAVRVREEGPNGVAEITDNLTRDELVALTVVLAAGWPTDQSVYDLLDWVNWNVPGQATA